MPCAAYRELLAEIVGLSSRSIQIWFQNRRQKLKQEENKETQERVQQRKEQALKILNSAYEINSTPSEQDLERLSEEIGISTKSIHVWFQNRLAKQKVEDQFGTVKKKTSVELSPSYFRPQQRSEPPHLTPNQVSSVGIPSTIAFTQAMPMMMPMMELQHQPLVYTAYMPDPMLDTYPSPMYSMVDSNPPSPLPETDFQGCLWNPFAPIFSAVKPNNHNVLDQPLFGTTVTPEDIMKDFSL
jgi:hypothetical protein